MADDTTLFIANIKSLEKAIEKFRRFEQFSGLKLNLSKTELIPIGNLKNKNIELPESIIEIRVKHGPFKALGIWFTTDTKVCTELNLEDRLKNMETLINIWRSRNLSLKGKTTIIKTLILPQIQFLFSMIYIPDNIIERIDKMLFNFLWDNKTAKIKKLTMIAPIEDGGLGMIDVHEVHRAAKCGWIKRIYDNTQSKWKITTQYMLAIPIHAMNKNLDKKVIKECKSDFHSQILSSWIELHNIEPSSTEEILNEYLILNRHIQVENKSIPENFCGNNNNNIKIAQIINEEGKFKTLEILNRTLTTNITTMQYNSIKSAIPLEWKQKLKTGCNTQNIIASIQQDTTPWVKINSKPINITEISTKKIYLTLIKRKIQEGVCIEKWISRFPFLGTMDWSVIYKLAFKTSTEPYLQSFQYKIIQGTLNCNYNLNKWTILDNNKCLYCEEIDTIEHRLYACEQSRLFWKRLQEWMRDNLEVSFPLTVCEVLFGINLISDPNVKVMNFIILLGKWYINNTKQNEKPLYFINFLTLLQNKISAMVNGNKIQCRNTPEWQNILVQSLMIPEPEIADDTIFFNHMSIYYYL